VNTLVSVRVEQAAVLPLLKSVALHLDGKAPSDFDSSFWQLRQRNPISEPRTTATGEDFMILIAP
jgi:hypothetical protein